MPPVASALGRTARPNISAAEWEQRVNLAACYRLVEHFGWTDLIYTHISARVPASRAFPAQPFRPPVRRGDGLEPDQGRSRRQSGRRARRANAPAGFVIHSAIHGGRDDVDCVIHTHSKAGVAVAAMQDGLLPSASTHSCSTGA